MSGRLRRRQPASIVDVRRLMGEIEKLAVSAERDYVALHSSGYTKPHRKDTEQLGDPADMVAGLPGRVRHLLTRASESIDQAHDGLLNARVWLGRVVTLIDETSSNLGVDEDLPTASRAEVRQAETMRSRRDDRARHSGAPWAIEEVTG